MATVSDRRAVHQVGKPAAQHDRRAGWTPANPAPLGLFGLRPHDRRAQLRQRQHRRRRPRDVTRSCSAWRSRSAGSRSCFAGMWEFRTGNTFGAVAFSSFGAFWISFFVLVSFNVAQLPATRGELGTRPVSLCLGRRSPACLFLCTFASAAGATAPVPAADGDVRPARDRQTGAHYDDHPHRRLRRNRDSGGGGIHRHGGLDEGRLRAFDAADWRAGTAVVVL